jgi:hypothetical protein
LYANKNALKWADGVAQMVERKSSKCEALSSNSSAVKKKCFELKNINTINNGEFHERRKIPRITSFESILLTFDENESKTQGNTYVLRSIIKT